MTSPITWSAKNPACQNTYDILVGLLQLSRSTSFAEAEKLLVQQLTYFPRASPAAAVTRAHASQMAWQFCDRLLRITNIKESPTLTLNQFIRRFETLFGVGTTTLKDIAQAADDFLRFPKEK
jgi:hypothetical protein